MKCSQNNFVFNPVSLTNGSKHWLVVSSFLHLLERPVSMVARAFPSVLLGQVLSSLLSVRW